MGVNPESDRVWIELERPRDELHAQAIADKANRMMARLAAPSDPGRRFYWSSHERCWCWGGDMGYVTLPDNGHWFSLDYLGRE